MSKHTKTARVSQSLKHHHAWLGEVNEKTWVISDTHFNHDRIMTYEPSRLTAMQAQGYRSMDEWMIDSWNSVVAEDEFVLHLGDFSFKGVAPFMDRLNGRIILLLGNHDVPALAELQRYATSRAHKLYVHQGCEGLTEPEEVSGLIKNIGAKKVMFSHYPLISVDPYTRGKAKQSRDAMAQVFIDEACDICVHGHLHSKDDHTDRYEVNVSMERIGFAPKRLADVLKGRYETPNH